jgi:nucleotidyltransferase/DNA polymerase involved in DNA repair
VARILCAHFEHLGLLAAWRRHPELRNEPVIVGSGPLLQLPVVAASAAARAVGVCAGMPLRQAQQLCPRAVILDLDVEAVAELRAAALDGLCAVVPSVEMGDEFAYADLGGRHAQHPGEAAWAAAAARALTRGLGEAPAVGVAGSRFTAWMAARVSSPRHVRRVRPGEEAAFLAPLPTGLLPVDAAVVARLGALGLDCLGAVAALSPADLGRQFGGDAGLAVHRYARGEDEAPVTPATAPRTIVERLVIEGGGADRELLSRCARRACAELGGRLRERGLAAGRVGLVLEGEGGPPLAAGTRVPPAPAGSAAELWAAVLGLLAALEPGAPVAGLRLEVDELATASGRQVELWRRGDAERDAVAHAVARLQDRFGAATVVRPRLTVDPGDLPERRFAWELVIPAPQATRP